MRSFIIAICIIGVADFILFDFSHNTAVVCKQKISDHEIVLAQPTSRRHLTVQPEGIWRQTGREGGREVEWSSRWTRRKLSREGTDNVSL